MSTPFFRKSETAYNNAIIKGYFNATRDSRNSLKYAGNWMYMHSVVDGEDIILDAFKNINTREYMHIPA